MDVSIVIRDFCTSISIGRHVRATSCLGLMTLIGVASGCGGDSTAPRASSGPVYWALRLNYHAVNMATVAPVDTVRLTAVPLDTNGTPIAGLGRVTFSTPDSAVSVDSTGLVTAHYITYAGEVARVIASLQSPTLNATHADTVFIQVTDTVPQHGLASFSVQPAAGDSAQRPVDDPVTAFGQPTTTFPWRVHIIDVMGDSVCVNAGCPLVVYYTSSHPAVATIDSHTGIVSAHTPGRTLLMATTWYYGQERQDSVQFSIGYRAEFVIDIGLSAQSGDAVVTFNAPPRVVLGVNTLVTWECVPENEFLGNRPICGAPVDVAFDHPATIDTGSKTFFNGLLQVGPSGRGNIPAFGGDTLESGDPFVTALLFYNANLRMRRFPTPGTYRYFSTRFPSDTFEIIISPSK